MFTHLSSRIPKIGKLRDRKSKKVHDVKTLGTESHKEGGNISHRKKYMNNEITNTAADCYHSTYKNHTNKSLKYCCDIDSRH